VGQTFDPKTLTASGTPAAIAEDVQYFNARDIANFSAAANTIVYVPAVTNPSQIGVFDRTGRLIEQKGR